MANVQLENGYTRIANEILGALARTKLNGTQHRILDVIIRNTYGYNKKIASLSDSYISKATGIHQKQVNREVNNLVGMGIVIVEYKGDYNNPRKIGLNKNFDNWTCSKTVTCSENVTTNRLVDETTSNSVDELVMNQLPNKDINKDIFNKDIYLKKIFADDSVEMELSRDLLNRIKDNYPKLKEPNIQSWCKNIELMLHKDGRSPEEIRQVIEFAQVDEFWKCNILSTQNLRKQYDRLYMQSQIKRRQKPALEQDIYEEVMKNLKNKQKG